MLICYTHGKYKGKLGGFRQIWVFVVLSLLKINYEEIKKIKEDKQKLIIQLVEMEELKVENKRLKNY